MTKLKRSKIIVQFVAIIKCNYTYLDIQFVYRIPILSKINTNVDRVSLMLLTVCLKLKIKQFL